MRKVDAERVKVGDVVKLATGCCYEVKDNQSASLGQIAEITFTQIGLFRFPAGYPMKVMDTKPPRRTHI